MYKLCFYVPVDAIEVVKKAVFDAGGGRIGNYDCCAWQVLGAGQFRALNGANPSVGAIGQVESLAEYRVELVVARKNIAAVIHALKAAHPYEEPAFSVLEMIDIEALLAAP